MSKEVSAFGDGVISITSNDAWDAANKDILFSIHSYLLKYYTEREDGMTHLMISLTAPICGL